jgi:hypothetical protein
MERAGKPLTVAVLVKQVPDMNAVKVDRAAGTPILSSQQVVNSYDEYAIEEALRLKERFGGEVVAVTAGPAGAKDVLTRALAMGADRAVHVEISDPNGLDTWPSRGCSPTSSGRLPPTSSWPVRRPTTTKRDRSEPRWPSCSACRSSPASSPSR